MVALGYGKWVRADRVFAVVPLEADERGDGRRTYVHVEGMSEPIVASRSERAILADVEAALAEAAGRAAAPRAPRRSGPGVARDLAHSRARDDPVALDPPLDALEARRGRALVHLGQRPRPHLELVVGALRRPTRSSPRPCTTSPRKRASARK